MKRLLLLSAISALLFISCAAPETPASEHETLSSTTETSGEDARLFTDDLGSFDFNGDEFNFFSRQQDIPMFRGALDVAEETGDVLNDSVFLRNRRLEERFNFIMKENVQPTTDAARTSVISGDDTYDVISTRCVYAFNYAEEGLIYSVGDLAHINLDKGYWDEKLTSEMTVMNKMYFAVGAFNLTSYDFTHVLLFNKKITDDHNLDNLYTVVSDNKWTFDKYNTYVTAVTKDLNGDSIMDSEDMFGFVAAGKQIPPNFWIAAGLKSVNKDAADLPVFGLASDEKFFSVFEKLYQITRDNNSWMYTKSTANIPDEALAQFQNDGALFLDCTAYVIPSLRAMETDFGIIPYPMWDETQDDYHSRIEGCELFCVPVTNKDLEMTSVILEGMASDSAGVLDAYYEVSLRTKFTRDEESLYMLDIIFSNRVFDWGDTIWCPDIRDGIFDDMFIENDRDLSSKIAALETTVLGLIDKTVTAFTALN